MLATRLQLAAILLALLVLPFLGGCPCLLDPAHVVSTDPANGAINVPLDATISITFDRAALPDTLDGTIVPSVGYTLAWSQNNTVVTVTPTMPLAANTTYKATITACYFADTCALVQPVSFSFTTVGASSTDTGQGARNDPQPDSSSGATYYVAAHVAGASDSNDGLSPTFAGGTQGPWSTIQHAANMMQAGDTTHILAGTYYENMIRFTRAGTAGARIALSGEGPTNVFIDGGGGQAGIVIDPGVGHVALEGLTVQNLSGYAIIAGLEGDQRRAAEIRLHDVHVNTFGGGNSPNAVAGIILYNVDTFSLDQLETADGGSNGVQLVDCTNGTVTNSTFHGSPGPLANGLETQQGHDIKISNCVAHNNAVYGFDISLWPKQPPFAHNITVEECFAYDNGHSGFAVNSRSHNVVFRRNIAWRNGFDPTSAWGGFVCYDGAYNVTFEHNVSIGNDGPGFIISNSSWQEVMSFGPLPDNTFTFRNNVTQGNTEGALMVEGTNEWTIIAEYNNWNALASGQYTVYVMGQVFTPAQINAGALGTGNICADPLFVNAGAEPPNVHLQSNSPCIDAGVSLGQTYAGNAPDMGRYERVE
ncbi:MAG: right-handed parallel beta-helix repeat-containing protein [Planctomycetes bacterium]|nr:right-handed parallel beta-helix repeat-containing protein [Planctomycetota bacterium]